MRLFVKDLHVKLIDPVKLYHQFSRHTVIQVDAAKGDLALFFFGKSFKFE
ncbi:MAG TPA: hypothetical protein VGM63_09365 [Mucilaginibacter sp.]|jgi:hypothetical protein